MLLAPKGYLYSMSHGFFRLQASSGVLNLSSASNLFLLSGQSFFRGLHTISQTPLNNHPILRLIVPYTQESEIYSIISLGEYTKAWEILETVLSKSPYQFTQVHFLFSFIHWGISTHIYQVSETVL